jgi:hypothetical protein
MRKVVATITAGALILGGAALPAGAAGKKKKKIEESFVAQALPLPNLSSATGTADRSCLAGVEGVHKVSHPFEAPANGTIAAIVEGFTGDWDLFLTDEAGKEMVGSVQDQTAGASAEESFTYPLKKGQAVNITPCNWLGQPEVEVTYTFVSK